MSVGSKILCDDGSLVMTVIECRPESIVVRVHNDHLLEEKKNMNLPGWLVSASPLLGGYDLELS